MERVNANELEFRNGESGPKYLFRGPRVDWGLIRFLPGETLGELPGAHPFTPHVRPWSPGRAKFRQRHLIVDLLEHHLDGHPHSEVLVGTLDHVRV